MVSAFELEGHIFRPHHVVQVWRDGEPLDFGWLGFARVEVLHWWRQRGAEVVHIPADRFAVRSQFDHVARWFDLPPGSALKGVIDRSRTPAVVRLLTRAATQAESIRLQVPRAPVIEAFQGKDVPPPEANAQPDLFGLH